MEASNNNHEFLSEDLQKAAKRVFSSDSLKFLAVQQKLKYLIDQQSTIRSASILGKRELYELSISKDREDIDEDSLLRGKVRLREERDQLHKALAKHKALADSLQEAAFVTQVQNAVLKNLKSDSAISEELRVMMECYNENLSLGAKLGEALSDTESLEKKILHLRVKYRIHLQSIENKWKTLVGMKSKKGESPKPNPGVKTFIEKLNKRQERLYLLICILQGLISSSGEKWGRNPRLVEVMLMCDRANTFLGGYVDTTDDVVELHQAREQDKRKTAKRNPMEKFISSTPKEKS